MEVVLFGGILLLEFLMHEFGRLKKYTKLSV